MKDFLKELKEWVIIIFFYPILPIIITILIALLILPTNIEAKTYSKKECKQYAYKQVLKKGWSLKDYNNLVKLWNKESNWNAKARNKRRKCKQWIKCLWLLLCL